MYIKNVEILENANEQLQSVLPPLLFNAVRLSLEYTVNFADSEAEYADYLILGMVARSTRDQCECLSKDRIDDSRFVSDFTTAFNFGVRRMSLGLGIIASKGVALTANRAGIATEGFAAGLRLLEKYSSIEAEIEAICSGGMTSVEKVTTEDKTTLFSYAKKYPAVNTLSTAMTGNLFNELSSSWVDRAADMSMHATMGSTMVLGVVGKLIKYGIRRAEFEEGLAGHWRELIDSFEPKQA